MAAAVKTAMLVVLAVLPGGFVALLAYVTWRALLQSWHRAAASSQENGKVIRATFSGVRVKDIAREARAVLAM